MRKILATILLLSISTLSHSKDEQYICEFNTEVIIGNSTSDRPTPTVKKISEKYTFFFDGNNASYINLSDGVKIPLYVIKESKRIIFIEKNLSDHLFVIAVFTDKKSIGNQYGSVKSFISHGVTDKFYDPSQSFGRCSVIDN